MTEKLQALRDAWSRGTVQVWYSDPDGSYQGHGLAPEWEEGGQFHLVSCDSQTLVIGLFQQHWRTLSWDNVFGIRVEQQDDSAAWERGRGVLDYLWPNSLPALPEEMRGVFRLRGTKCRYDAFND